MNSLIHAKDPFNAVVVLHTFLCDEKGLVKDFTNLQKAIAASIENPALLVHVFGVLGKRYYFRSIHWQRTLLIVAHEENGIWSARECIENPSGQFMLGIYLQGIQLV
jgi:hypothetical protein